MSEVDVKDMTLDEVYGKYEKLLRFIIKKYTNKNTGVYNYDDLYQVACLAMVEAYKNYDPSIGKFSTYLYKYVWGRVMQYMCRNDSNFSFRYRNDGVYANQFEIVNLDDVMIAGERFDRDCICSELFGEEDKNFELFELCDSAKRAARNEKWYQMWYRVYIDDLPAATVAKDFGISRERIRQILNAMNVKLGATYFKDEAQHIVERKKLKQDIV